MDTGPTASTDIHPSSWRTWRSAHVRVYEYIYMYFPFFVFFFVCEHLLWRKTLSRHTPTHTHTLTRPTPHCHHLVKDEQPLRREGRADPAGLVPSRSRPFFLLHGTKRNFLYKRTRRTSRGQTGGAAAQPAAISSPGVKVEFAENGKGSVCSWTRLQSQRGGLTPPARQPPGRHPEKKSRALKSS